MTSSPDSPTRTREIHLASRPHGEPTPDNFRLVEVDVPELAGGEVLVRNTVMSVDPYMRGRMNDAKSYVTPFLVDAPLEGGAVGEVVASRSDDVPVGAAVLHQLGWRDHAVVPAAALRVVDAEAGTGPAGLPGSAYLGVLGMPGLTAYVGLTRIAHLAEGETVYVSGAAGAVGSVVGQLARHLGAARVVGSAGSPEKVAMLVDELGFDAAFDYHDGSVASQLREHAPDGVDVCFDNVGGATLEAGIGAMREHGRVALCGAISVYNATQAPPGPRNMGLLVTRKLTLRGFIVSDHGEAAGEFHQRATPWVADGSLQVRETVRNGLDAAPSAFIDLLSGSNTGKMLVRL